MELIIVLAIVGLIIAGAAWLMLDARKARHALEEHPGSFAPYKIEAPDETPKDVALSDHTALPVDHLEPYGKPKRKYTKRSTYWTARKKKAAARKAKSKKTKTKRK